MTRLTLKWLFVLVLLRGSADAAIDPILLKQAQRGDVNAQFNLGVMYDKGEGAPKDSVEAVRWYRKAAEQGDDDAQFNLGLMYEKGEGVPNNLVQSHAWINIAAAKGIELAKKKMPVLEEKMTSEQKAEAMKLARELFAKLPKG